MKPRRFTMRGTIAAVVLLGAGCGGKADAPGPVVMDEAAKERWEIDLVEMRIEKNEAFMDSAQTALPLQDLAGFEGLNYYYPNLALRFKVPFQASAGRDTIFLTKRKGQKVPYLRQGKVSFLAEGKKWDLTIFGPAQASETDYLWLPFFDATNQDETYAGGRYLDLELGDEGTVELDFNYAYNPLCDYNPVRYNCTLPPEGNRLPFPVRAGEKRFRPAE